MSKWEENETTSEKLVRLAPFNPTKRCSWWFVESQSQRQELIYKSDAMYKDDHTDFVLCNEGCALQDVIRRDITTARRIALLETLWNERYLTQSQLIARVELRVGKKCFGISEWEDTFYRDIRFVKQAFEVAGYRLLYSRKKERPGYYLERQSALSSEIKQVLKGSAAEVDQRQIDIYCKVSFAERFHQGCSISDTARKVVAYRIRQDNPKLSLMEANRIALQRAYRR